MVAELLMLWHLSLLDSGSAAIARCIGISSMYSVKKSYMLQEISDSDGCGTGMVCIRKRLSKVPCSMAAR